MNILGEHNWERKITGSCADRYRDYLLFADDGKGNDITTGEPLKTYD